MLATLQQATRVAVITGAGMSAESGVPTFRGAGGLWRSYRPEDLATQVRWDVSNFKRIIDGRKLTFPE